MVFTFLNGSIRSFTNVADAYMDLSAWINILMPSGSGFHQVLKPGFGLSELMDLDPDEITSGQSP